MASVQVFWTEQSLDFDDDLEYKLDQLREVHTGVLTDEAEDATTEQPVVVEDLTGRVYLPGDFGSDTVLYIESASGALPALAEAAVEAGYHVAHADDRGRTWPETAPRPEEDRIDPHTI